MDIQETAKLAAVVHGLAKSAREISSTLHPMAQDCGHDAARMDISKIADELALLSTTLVRLEEAMLPNLDMYTDIFYSDLAEIAQELELVFEEINQCCNAIHKLDASSTATVPWMFRKGQVTRLNKHLEALKTTLVVMRNVLWEGTDSGKDGNLLGGRAFLEAAITDNRNTISELYDMDALMSSSDHNPSTMSKRPDIDNEGPSVMSIHDGPACGSLGSRHTMSSSELKDHDIMHEVNLNRRFSKRGVRLGVHTSILDHGAHDAPEYLRQKWAVQARFDRKRDPLITRSVTTAVNPDLSTIAESDSIAPQADAKKDRIDEGLPGVTRAATASTWSSFSGSNARTDTSASRIRRQFVNLKDSPVGQTVRKAIRKMSHMNLRSQAKADEESHTHGIQNSKDNESDHDKSDTSSGLGERMSKQKKDSFLRILFGLPSRRSSHESDYFRDTEGGQQSGL